MRRCETKTAPQLRMPGREHPIRPIFVTTADRHGRWLDCRRPRALGAIEHAKLGLWIYERDYSANCNSVKIQAELY